jgi:hypothetical protein
LHTLFNFLAPFRFICDDSSGVETDSANENSNVTPEKSAKTPQIKKESILIDDSDEDLPAFQSESAKKKKKIVDLSDDDDNQISKSSSDDSDVMILEEESTKNKAPSNGDDKVLRSNTDRPRVRKTRATLLEKDDLDEREVVGEEEEETVHWWSEIVTPECEIDFTLSGKLVIFEKILKMCHEKDEKL